MVIKSSVNANPSADQVERLFLSSQDPPRVAKDAGHLGLLGLRS